MIEAVRTNQSFSVVDYDKVCEYFPNASYEINEVKKEYKRSPEYKSKIVYRNGTGKRTKTMKKIDTVYEVECDEQVMLEEKLAMEGVDSSIISKLRKE